MRASSLRWLHLPYDEGRQEGGGERHRQSEKKQRVRRKRPERSVKLQREAWGTGEHNDVISIDSHGEHIFTVLYNLSLKRQEGSGRPVHLKLRLNQT